MNPKLKNNTAEPPTPPPFHLALFFFRPGSPVEVSEPGARDARRLGTEAERLAPRTGDRVREKK